MQRSCKELKRIARENLTNKYALPMRAYLYTIMITTLVELPFTWLQTEETFSTQNIILYIAELIISVAAIVLTCGEYRIHMQMAKGQKASMKDYFYPLKQQPDRYILGRLLYVGMLILGALPMILAYGFIGYAQDMLILLAIPLALLSCVLIILVSIHFDLVFLLMLDQEELGILESFKEISRLMKGHKGRYFYMSLSFLGMLFLSALSFGIATIWIKPYIEQTSVLLYLDITGQLDAIETAKKESQTAFC